MDADLFQEAGLSQGSILLPLRWTTSLPKTFLLHDSKRAVSPRLGHFSFGTERPIQTPFCLLCFCRSANLASREHTRFLSARNNAPNTPTQRLPDRQTIIPMTRYAIHQIAPNPLHSISLVVQWNDATLTWSSSCFPSHNAAWSQTGNQMDGAIQHRQKWLPYCSSTEKAETGNCFLLRAAATLPPPSSLWWVRLPANNQSTRAADLCSAFALFASEKS